jgi:SAM-dependent methyltransferase
MNGANWTLYELAHENNELNKKYFENNGYKNFTSFIKSIEAIKFILQSEKKAIELLDIGCGSGWQAICFEKEGLGELIKYNGLDISKHMCNFATKNYPNGNFFVADIVIDNLEKKFDVVMESAVIELVSDWKKCISGMVKHSKKWLIFHRMFFTNDKTILEQAETYNKIPDLRRHIGLTELSDELSQHGFSLVKKDVWNISPQYRMGTFIAKMGVTND